MTGDVVTDVIALAKKKQHRMFFVLCASASLRHGEALGIDIKNISPDCSTINICQKAWPASRFLEDRKKQTRNRSTPHGCRYTQGLHWRRATRRSFVRFKDRQTTKPIERPATMAASDLGNTQSAQARSACFPAFSPYSHP